MEKNVLTLLDGREVALFPLSHDKEIEDYLVIHNRRNVPYAEALHFTELKASYNHYQQYLSDKYETETDGARILLLENIKLIYDNAERILNDSRMFLAPMPCAGGLAYCSTRMFDKPALGVYLQWWMTCKEAHSKDDEWVYYISGSPLSGMNSCGKVDSNGSAKRTCLSGFLNAWRTFIHVNKIYQGLSDSCEHYTIKEVIEMLK